ncbi:hypothetical protein [Streptomyces sp. NPDC046371]|uniref:hypothetical protein n=1 Tax=unclassified Streptomyces TaxID=2593676 RepID=UPI00340D6415
MTVLLLTAACAALLLVAASRTWDSAAERHAPQTVSAAGLNLALNDMDAQGANILLSNGDAGRGRMDVPYMKATEFYETARHTISGDLRTLAVAAEGGPSSSACTCSRPPANSSGSPDGTPSTRSSPSPAPAPSPTTRTPTRAATSSTRPGAPLTS